MDIIYSGKIDTNLKQCLQIKKIILVIYYTFTVPRKNCSKFSSPNYTSEHYFVSSGFNFALWPMDHCTVDVVYEDVSRRVGLGMEVG